MVTRFPARASVLDAEGRPLEVPSLVYVLGVWPDRLAEAATAQGFADVTGLDAAQVLGQITAAPPREFLRLASLDPATYARLRCRLRSVPGLVIRPESERLFQAEATGLVGHVGSEVNQVLRDDGAYYVPGTTVGLSGLEADYQHELLGTPTIEVVAVNSAGVVGSVLARWPGVSGTPVRTTIDSSVQGAALAALEGVRIRARSSRSRRRRAGAGGGPASGVRRAARRGCARREAGPGHRVHHRVGRGPARRRGGERCPRRSRARTRSPSAGRRSPATGPERSSRLATISRMAAVRRSPDCPSGSRPASLTRWSRNSASGRLVGAAGARLLRVRALRERRRPRRRDDRPGECPGEPAVDGHGRRRWWTTVAGARPRSSPMPAIRPRAGDRAGPRQHVRAAGLMRSAVRSGAAHAASRPGRGVRAGRPGP